MLQQPRDVEREEAADDCQVLHEMDLAIGVLGPVDPIP
jgi:hypothetical protein